MKLITGLGNPGKQYQRTRHNIGFQVIDHLSDRFHIPLDKEKFNGLYGSGEVDGEKVILLKPLTYMNLSGEAIRPLVDFYKLSITDLLVIYDDLDLPTGKIRLRMKGSAGGHNGIKSIIQHFNTQEFKRIRVGIDRPPKGEPVINYVLGEFSKSENETMIAATEKTADACQDWLRKPFIEVMNDYNQS